ncbi:MAG: hypothetical protein OMM_09720 [Candidatus Magnetoglobus multicellularis str. Araruama]|uniref:Uncharacterized protein n=1 Tax=Candidatus Magnetoglobus multicellularis str. Araruama TaxID=890399 RepID=A0A1V1P3C3_9BACT|nr:MAG: hypothetical protein OMM_09720 [Candidatus Magnetoglobus multicellularis str. Araruama]
MNRICKKNISVSQADIDAFYQRYPKQSIAPLADHPLKNEVYKIPENNSGIITFIRKEKIEDTYPRWIKELKERYGLYLSFDKQDRNNNT